MAETVAGAWTVADATIVTPEGVTEGFGICDEDGNVLTSTARPADLMVALAEHLGVERFELTSRME